MSHSDLDAAAAQLLDETAYVSLATIDPDGRPRVSPVYFTPHGSALYWVSHPDAQHSLNLARDDRVSGVVLDSHSEVGRGRAVYVVGHAAEVPPDRLVETCRVAFRPERGGRAFAPEELEGAADLRLYVLHVEVWETHVSAGDPTHGTGRDHRVVVRPSLGAGSA